MLRALPSDTAALIRASAEMYDVDEIIMSIVNYSLASNATRLNIILNLPTSISVSDNGEGMSREQLRALRYDTSPLASAACVSNLAVTSRTSSAQTAYTCVLPSSNNEAAIYEASDWQQNGTRVIISEVFAQLPVRQKGLLVPATQQRVTDTMRHRLSRLAVLHHGVGFSLCDTKTQRTILSSHASGSPREAFAHIFDRKLAEAMVVMKSKTDEFVLTMSPTKSGQGPRFYNVHGLVTRLDKGSFHNRDFQLLYINNMPAFHRGVRLLMERIYSDLWKFICPRNYISSKTEQNPSVNIPHQKFYPVYTLFIRCSSDLITSVTRQGRHWHFTLSAWSMLESLIRDAVMEALYRTHPVLLEVVSEELYARSKPSVQKSLVKEDPLLNVSESKSVFNPSPVRRKSGNRGARRSHAVMAILDEDHVTPQTVKRPRRRIAEKNLNLDKVRNKTTDDNCTNYYDPTTGSFRLSNNASASFELSPRSAHAMANMNLDLSPSGPGVHRLAVQAKLLPNQNNNSPMKKLFEECTSGRFMPQNAPVSQARAQHIELLESKTITRDMLRRLTAVGQMGDTFICAEVDGYLVLVDPHAADERHLLELYQRNMQQHLEQRKLQTLEVVKLTVNEVATVLTCGNQLHKALFRYELLSDERMLKVTHVPVLFTIALNMRDLREYLSALAYHGPTMPAPAFDRILKSRSCRDAVMIGKSSSFSRTQQQKLIDNLSACEFPFNCGHGRPTMAILANIPRI